MIARVVDGREAAPSAGVADSQSVKTTEAGDCYGSGAGGKITRRRRRIAADTRRQFTVRRGALRFHLRPFGRSRTNDQAWANFPTLGLFYADSGASEDAVNKARMGLEAAPSIVIVRRQYRVVGIVVSARRWVVERTFAGPRCARRLAEVPGAFRCVIKRMAQHRTHRPLRPQYRKKSGAGVLRKTLRHR